MKHLIITAASAATLYAVAKFMHIKGQNDAIKSLRDEQIEQTHEEYAEEIEAIHLKKISAKRKQEQIDFTNLWLEEELKVINEIFNSKLK